MPERSSAKFLFWMMAIATGLSVANLYYCQPLLQQMQQSFSATANDIGWIPTLTQLGYAVGMLFLIPLGDRFEKRKLVFISTLISAASLFLMASARSLGMATFASFLVGLATMTPQFLIPLAAHLSGEKKRGQVLGMMMSGLLLGILLARTVSGFVGGAYGWRSMFVFAAVLLLINSILLWMVIPVSKPTFHGSYGKLLLSVLGLVRELPLLRESMWIGGALFGAFSAFWATLIFLVESPSFQLGPRTVGLFGLLGAAGALAAPLVGRLSDRKSPRMTIFWGLVIVALAFLIYLVWGGHSLVALGLGVVLMDIGIQGAHVANQSRVFAIRPEARSRLNTAYMFAYFSGGAMGSALGSSAWARYGWPGVCIVSLSLVCVAAIAFVSHRWPVKPNSTLLRQ
jgi:predicted MFS family arabinose efflux permease